MLAIADADRAGSIPLTERPRLSNGATPRQALVQTLASRDLRGGYRPPQLALGEAFAGTGRLGRRVSESTDVGR